VGLWRTATERGDMPAVFGDKNPRAVTEKVERDAEPGGCGLVAYQTILCVSVEVELDATPPPADSCCSFRPACWFISGSLVSSVPTRSQESLNGAARSRLTRTWMVTPGPYWDADERCPARIGAGVRPCEIAGRARSPSCDRMLSEGYVRVTRRQAAEWVRATRHGFVQ
jgi:hypothetical protein